MCRYAFHTYKDHFACFVCRKTFKHFLFGEAVWGRRSLERPRIERDPLCPQCRAPMANMGLDFRAPKQSDHKQWRKVELLYLNNVTFHNCGCGVGRRPQSLHDVPAFLRSRWQESAGVRLRHAIDRKAETSRKTLKRTAANVALAAL
jgi:hypothetical protein